MKLDEFCCIDTINGFFRPRWKCSLDNVDDLTGNKDPLKYYLQSRYPSVNDYFHENIIRNFTILKI